MVMQTFIKNDKNALNFALNVNIRENDKVITHVTPCNIMFGCEFYINCVEVRFHDINLTLPITCQFLS